MIGFIDEAIIDVGSGNGGSGAVSFRREKYVPFGGPDGGDGGKGGDIIFVVKENLKTLARTSQKKIFRAKNGASGAGRLKHGKNGEDVVIPVPPGTLIKDPVTGAILKDLKEPEESWVFLKGGRGGKGNKHFTTSTRQAPKYAQPGMSGRSVILRVELNIIADIGLVGSPNAGKSTLLSVLTNAHPKIASYPFTTKVPNLGVLRIYERDIVIADIPGIIEGASSGAGLGFRFLMHICRTRLLLFMIDLSNQMFLENFQTVKDELQSFRLDLLEKNRLILGTKIDVAEENLKILDEQLPDERVMGISAVTGQGINELKQVLVEMIAEESRK